jgi:hypothetical protein
MHNLYIGTHSLAARRNSCVTRSFQNQPSNNDCSLRDAQNSWRGVQPPEENHLPASSTNIEGKLQHLTFNLYVICYKGRELSLTAIHEMVFKI